MELSLAVPCNRVGDGAGFERRGRGCTRSKASGGDSVTVLSFFRRRLP